MNKRTASDIIKKFADDNTRQEAIDLADKNGYSMRVQIEKGVETLISVYDENDSVYADNLVEEVDSVEESTAKAATTPPATPATDTPKKT